MKGLIGQVRGFDLDDFLSDWEDDRGRPIPWTYGDSTLPVPMRGQPGPGPSAAGAPATSSSSIEWTDIPRLMAAEGVPPKLQVLYVPDYVADTVRVARTAELFRELGRVFPNELDRMHGTEPCPL